MGLLRILKVEYSGDKFHFESPSLDQPLSIIEGPNGSGKSTFFNLIHFGLGGKVAEFDKDSPETHKQVTGDTNNMVRLVISIDDQVYTLTRRLGENLVTVFRPDSEADGVKTGLVSLTLPIFRREDHLTFSDWLLEKLEIPVVEIFQGGKNFKLNFTDLSRLIYHNQQPDPLGIFKPADSANFISDSLEIRRAIFQILVGKTQLELYEAIGRLKLADRDLQAARTVHQEYVTIVKELLTTSGFNEVQNVKALAAQVEEQETQLHKLLVSRKGLGRGGGKEDAARASVQGELRVLDEMDGQRSRVDDERFLLMEQAGRMLDVERSIKDDIERINKVIYTHGQLNLFSSDTCPFCLNTVTRAKDKCVCGHDVDEHTYRRFFYSPAEYLEILRSKTKTLDTIRLATASVNEEAVALQAQRDALTKTVAEKRSRLEAALGNSQAVDAALEELDEKILETRERLGKLQEALRLESKLESLQTRLTFRKGQFDTLKAEVGRLDAASKAELQSQLAALNSIYNDLMTTVLAECRVATIDPETYLPLINNGEYREASANVPKRFLYYLALLQLSLETNVPFPRLLLVDTPETAGIDLANLVLMLGQITALKNPHLKAFQIVLSTGVGKYPPELKTNVVLTLATNDKLLKPRTTVDAI